MKLRALSLGFLTIGATMVCQAQAAVSVLGTGLAFSCYEAAEYGGDPRNGIQTCSSAIQEQALTNSDRAATYINRGIMRSRSGDATGSLADYNKGLSIDGTLAEGYVDRGASYIALRRYDDAIADINKGLDMGAKKPEIAYYDRAIAYEALGNVRAAYEDYRKAVTLVPDFQLATEQLARFKIVRKPDGSM